MYGIENIRHIIKYKVMQDKRKFREKKLSFLILVCVLCQKNKQTLSSRKG